MGSSKASGELTFVTTAKVVMVKLSYFTWKTESETKSTTIDINGKSIEVKSEDFTTPSKTNFIFNEASNNVSIKTNKPNDYRLCITAFELYTIAK